MPVCKRVAIVGGGFSGVMCIRSLKEDNIEPVCYEKSSEIGGTWCYREEVKEGLPSTMWTTIINHSKEMGSISNMPPPAEYPNYMRHHELLKYFNSMVETYDLSKHVTCNREVVSVRRTEDYEETGRWQVVVKNTESGEVTSDIFDGVMVCVGHITYPKTPQVPGMDRFGGKLMHSHSLKRVEQFKGQRVAVVGTGCSALDAAVEISNMADQVYWSVRTPSWIVARVGPYGLPMDYVLLRRYSAFLQQIFPLRWLSNYLEKNFLDTKFSHKLYGINPKYPFLAKDPIVNDAISSKLLSGSVVLKSNISRFVDNGVIFENNENETTKLDAVIFATGYDWKFPFLEDGVIVQEGPRINLYKCIFPPHLKHPTLAVIGFLLPFGPGFPLGEIQTRWAAYLMSGQGKLPSKEAMMTDIKRRYEENIKRYSPSDKMSIRVDFIPYMDEIATELGVKPNFWKMMLKDHKLFKACVFGPCLPYQFRLEGPNKWDGARNAILTAHKRVRAPLRSKDTRTYKNKNTSNTLIKFAIVITIIAWLVLRKESAIKHYLLAFILPYLMSLRSFGIKYFFVLMLLPFYVTFQGFATSFFLTLFIPFVVSMFIQT